MLAIRAKCRRHGAPSRRRNVKLPRSETNGRIVGGNGVGKTILFEIITGATKPNGGSMRLGETVNLGYVDQSRSTLDPEKTVWEVISEGSDSIWLGRAEVNSRAYVGRFNFTGADQQKPVNLLSGGERNRISK